MGLQAVRNGPGGPFLTGDNSAWNTCSQPFQMEVFIGNLSMKRDLFLESLGIL